jgi:hypothetical protein
MKHSKPPEENAERDEGALAAKTLAPTRSTWGL